MNVKLDLTISGATEEQADAEALRIAYPDWLVLKGHTFRDNVEVTALGDKEPRYALGEIECHYTLTPRA